jgi:hypothetical protein
MISVSKCKEKSTTPVEVPKGKVWWQKQPISTWVWLNDPMKNE